MTRLILGALIILNLAACGNPTNFGSNSDCDSTFATVAKEVANIKTDGSSTYSDFVKAIGKEAELQYPVPSENRIEYAFLVDASSGSCGEYRVYASTPALTITDVKVYPLYKTVSH